MMLSLLLLAQAATAAPPPGQISAAGTGTFSAPALPDQAVRFGWTGTARADLTISPEGRVSGCKIVQSTRHQVLDDYVCKMLMTRARFTPAKDKDGKPIEGHFLTPPISFKYGN